MTEPIIRYAPIERDEQTRGDRTRLRIETRERIHDGAPASGGPRPGTRWRSG